jgi:hypothetical protein
MYLDRQGLTACWRETLLAQAVLAGRTRGYQSHPQLARFRAETDGLAVVGWYLHGLADEADIRGYKFDRERIDQAADQLATIGVTTGQLAVEWAWLKTKLGARSPAVLSRWANVAQPKPHRSFHIVEGPIASWERLNP